MPLSLFVTSNLIYKKKKNTTGFLKKLLSITILMRKRLKEIKRLIVKLNKGKKNLRFFFYKFNNKAILATNLSKKGIASDLRDICKRQADKYGLRQKILESKLIYFIERYSSLLKYKRQNTIINSLYNKERNLFYIKKKEKEFIKKRFKYKDKLQTLKGLYKKNNLYLNYFLLKQEAFLEAQPAVIERLKNNCLVLKKILLEKTFDYKFVYWKLFFNYTGSNFFCTLTDREGEVSASLSSGILFNKPKEKKKICSRKEKTTIFIAKELGELVSFFLYKFKTKKLCFIPLINHRKVNKFLQFFLEGLYTITWNPILLFKPRLKVIRNGVRQRKVPRK